MKILRSEFVQRIFENMQQIFRVTMHTIHTFIEHPNHQKIHIFDKEVNKCTLDFNKEVNKYIFNFDDK